MENLINTIGKKLMKFVTRHIKKVMKQLSYYVWGHCIIKILKNVGIWRKKIINLNKDYFLNVILFRNNLDNKFNLS
jgi:hypothetical protein